MPLTRGKATRRGLRAYTVGRPDKREVTALRRCAAGGRGRNAGHRGRALVCGLATWFITIAAAAQSVGVGAGLRGNAVRADALSGGVWVDIPCVGSHCVDSNRLRLQLRRELRAQALRDDRDGALARRAVGPSPSLYRSPRYVPPPTPAAQVQPRYRGSGDIRPEYLAGEAGPE